MGLPEDSSACRFRPMQSSDLGQVLQLERASYDFPWSEGIFRDCLRNHYVCQVAELDNQIIAYAVMQLGVDECHLLNVCVANDHRNRGIGRQIIQRVFAIARRRDMHSAFLEVRQSNIGALHLYDSMGFNEVGIRSGYYPAKDGREDAIVLAYEFT
jgi:ribosomal-protein-alanine N-acetyltransferase